MSPTTIKQVNSKLKQLPATLLEEVERYIDFLTFKLDQDKQDIPQWHKDTVLKRIQDVQKPVDAFEMLDDLYKE
ncbi:MAG TPA: hypothetical protein VLZ54_05370 [Arenibacter sp.]|nr:hypothetical protein [Arenibacter sp.]